MSRKTIIVMLTLVALGVVFSPRPERPETPTDVAYRICEACGLARSEIDRLIDDMLHSTLTREENLQLFRATFEMREDAELCIDCAEAVLDAAGEADQDRSQGGEALGVRDLPDGRGGGSTRVVRGDLGADSAVRCTSAVGAAWLTLVTERKVDGSSWATD